MSVLLRQSLLVIALVLLLRVPFLNQAIQGDDVNYLTAAQHAQIDPAHPNHVWFVFQGERVTMQGHPHPPLNAWTLAGLLALWGDIYETRYHAAYIVFSLIAALAALALARRFSTRPLAATCLFLATPAFVINGNSLESDLPFLAFWLATIALFVYAVDRRSTPHLIAAALTTPLAAMAAFQSVLLTPILAAYLWTSEHRAWRTAWAVTLTAPVVLLGWQAFEKLTSEQLPAAVLAGYFQTYGLQSLVNKAKNAAALTGHLGWLGFPALAWLIATRSKPLLLAGAAGAAAAALVDPHPLYLLAASAGVIVLALCTQQARQNWLAQWTFLFFAAALVLFFAGSARYLLPLAVPVTLLLADRIPSRWLWPAIAIQAALSLTLATVNYQHWEAYKDLIARHAREWRYERIWVNAEWGLRYYAETAGALPLVRGQAVRPGDIVITSKLSLPVDFTTGGGTLVPMEQTTIRPTLPLRLIGLNSKSAYSTADQGFRPFDLTSAPADEVTIHAVAERKPSLSYLPMQSEEAAAHIVSGIDKVEDNRYRWMGRRAVVLLKSPPEPTPLRVELYVPEQAQARRLTITVDGVKAGDFNLPQNGPYAAITPPLAPTGESATVTIEVDKTFQVPGDQRTLGVILVAAGFAKAN